MIYSSTTPYLSLYDEYDIDRINQEVFVKYKNISKYSYEELFEFAKENIINSIMLCGAKKYIDIGFVQSITVEDYLLSEHNTQKEIESDFRIKVYNFVIDMFDREMKFLSNLKEQNVKRKERKGFFNKILSFFEKLDS